MLTLRSRLVVLRTTAGAAAAAMLASCLPYTSYRVTPDLRGIVRDDVRQPVTVPLRVTARADACADPVQAAASDSAGRFHLPATRDGFWHSPFAVYRLAPREWTVCAGRAAAADTAWTPLVTVRSDGVVPPRRLTCTIPRDAARLPSCEVETP